MDSATEPACVFWIWDIVFSSARSWVVKSAGPGYPVRVGVGLPAGYGSAVGLITCYPPAYPLKMIVLWRRLHSSNYLGFAFVNKSNIDCK